MNKKYLFTILLFLIFFLFINTFSFATEETTNEVILYTLDETTENEENYEEDLLVEEQQEEQEDTNNNSYDHTEILQYLETISNNISYILDAIYCSQLLFACWFILDFIRHTFFKLKE